LKHKNLQNGIREIKHILKMLGIELLLDITNISKILMIKNKLKNNKMYFVCFI
jgi:hypothetical protein